MMDIAIQILLQGKIFVAVAIPTTATKQSFTAEKDSLDVANICPIAGSKPSLEQMLIRFNFTHLEKVTQIWI